MARFLSDEELPTPTYLVEGEEPQGSGLGGAFARGIDTMQLGLYAGVRSIGETLGIDFLDRWGQAGVERNIKEMLENPPEVATWDDVDSLADFGTYVLETLVEQAPQILIDVPLLAMGGGGGVAARRLALAQVGKSAKRKMGEEAFSKFRSAAPKIAMANIFLQSAGESALTLEAAGIDDPGALALAAGVPKAWLERVGLDSILGAARATKQPVESIAQAAKQAATAGGRAFFSEGGTETAQQFLDQMVVTAVTDDNPLFSEDNFKDLRESFLKGGIAGGGYAAGFNAIGSYLEYAERNKKQDLDDISAVAGVDPPSAIEGEPVPDEPSPTQGGGGENRPIPEPAEDVAAQLRAMEDPTSEKDAVLITEGSGVPDYAFQGRFETVDLGRDLLVTNNPDKARAARTANSEKLKSQILYNNPQTREESDGTAVQVRDRDGGVVSEQATSQEKLEEALRSAEGIKPEGGEVRVTTADTILNERLARLNKNRDADRQPTGQPGPGQPTAQAEGARTTDTAAEYTAPLYDFQQDPEQTPEDELSPGPVENPVITPDMALEIFKTNDPNLDEDVSRIPAEKFENFLPDLAERGDATVEDFVSEALNEAQRRGNANKPKSRRAGWEGSVVSVAHPELGVRHLDPMALSRMGMTLLENEQTDTMDLTQFKRAGLEFAVTQLMQAGYDTSAFFNEKGQLRPEINLDPQKGRKPRTLGETQPKARAEIKHLQQRLNLLREANKRFLENPDLAGLEKLRMVAKAIIKDSRNPKYRTALEADDAASVISEARRLQNVIYDKTLAAIESLLAHPALYMDGPNDVRELINQRDSGLPVLGKSTPGYVAFPDGESIVDRVEEEGDGIDTPGETQAESSPGPQQAAREEIKTEKEKDRAEALKRQPPVPDLRGKTIVSEAQYKQRKAQERAERDAQKKKADAEAPVTDGATFFDETLELGVGVFVQRSIDILGIKNRRYTFVSFDTLQAIENGQRDELQTVNRSMARRFLNYRTSMEKRSTTNAKMIGAVVTEGQDVIIALDSTKSLLDQLMFAGHELGHVFFRETMNNLPRSTYQRLYKAYESTLKNPNVFGIYPESQRFEEWIADQVAFFLVKDNKSTVDKGMPNLPPEVRNFLQKLADKLSQLYEVIRQAAQSGELGPLRTLPNVTAQGFIKHILGRGTAPSQAVPDNGISAAMAWGDIAPRFTPDAVLRNTKSALLSVRRWTAQLAKPLIMADTELRSMGPLGEKLADLWYRKTGDKRSGQGEMFSRIDREGKQWDKRLKTLLDNLGRDFSEADLKNGLEELTGAPKKMEDLTNPAAKEIRKFLDQFYELQLKPNMPSVVYEKGYFPRVHEIEQIQARPQQWKQILIDHGMAPADANHFLQVMLDGHSQAEAAFGLSVAPSNRFARSRQLRDPATLEALKAAGFLNENPAENLASYVFLGVQRSVWESTLGAYQETPSVYHVEDEIWAADRRTFVRLQEEQRDGMHEGKTLVQKTHREITHEIVKENGFRNIEEAVANRFVNNQGKVWNHKFAYDETIRTGRKAFAAAVVRARNDLGIDLRAVLKEKRGMIQRRGSAAFLILDDRPGEFHLGSSDLLTPQEIQRAQKIIQGYSGKLGLEQMNALHPKALKAQANAMMVTNWLTLGLAGIGQLVELPGVLKAAKGDLGTFIDSMKVAMGADSKQLQEMMEDIGVIESGALTDSMAQLYGYYNSGKTSQHGNNILFKINGVNWTVRTMSMMAGHAAAVSARRWTQWVREGGADAERGKRYLKELGLGADIVEAWDAMGSPLVPEGHDERGNYNAEEAAVIDAMIKAIHHFREEAVLLPNRAQRPTFGNDARFALVFHLKSYLYAFHDKVVVGIYREMRSRVHEDGLKPMLAWGMGIMGFYLAIAALSNELREEVKYALGTKYRPSNTMDADEYALHLITNVLGVGGQVDSLYVRPFEHRFGLLAGAASVAPLNSVALEILGQPTIGESLMEATPFVGQMPGLQRWLSQ